MYVCYLTVTLAYFGHSCIQ